MSIPERITDRVFRLVKSEDPDSPAYDEILDSRPVKCSMAKDIRVYKPKGYRYWIVFDGVTGADVTTADYLKDTRYEVDRVFSRRKPGDYEKAVASHELSPRYDREKLDEIEWLESYKGDGHSIRDYLAAHPEECSTESAKA